ncbi:GTPase Era, mitochondrial [Aricia agestis]|uniref:GTPase Era, mitochondrial n=1 Tax=Aricia agestis TaxID=91739 RepID=UPI001C207EF7|nr:GTPase Era, mitochondrial [Aricia agestis]
MFALSCRSLSRCSIQCLRLLYYSSQPKQNNPDDKKISKVINVAIVGAPNAGKSTLINKITERKICAASSKVHTTTKLVRAICFENDTQIIFLDTPGVITEKEKNKYKLPDSMLEACVKSLRCADVIGVVHDVSNKWTRESIHQDVLNMLELFESTPSFLVLNKVDTLKSKKQLLSLIRNLTNGFIAGAPIPNAKVDSSKVQRGYSKFSDVFIVSAKEGDGVKDIKDYLISNAKVSRLHYSPSEWSDQTPERLIEEAVRAKFLDFLAQEIPYNLTTQLEFFDDLTDENKITCSVCILCPTERLAKLINGSGGGRLHQIKSAVMMDLIEMFKKPVSIKIVLKVKSKSDTEDIVA